VGDLLYNFTDWLRSTPLIELSLWISETWFSLLIQTNFWAIPTIQAIHIVAIAALFGSALMVNLRVLGVLWTEQSVAQVGQRFTPWIRWGLVVLIISGLLLIIGEPIRELINSVFWVKMGMVVVTALLSMSFNKKVLTVESDGAIAGSMRGTAIVLIILWCAIMAGGRWIAYAPV
jgi:uncharacterized membrane protein